ATQSCSSVVPHAHFDHHSGMGDFIAEGAIVLTHEANVEFFERALAAPRTLAADRTLNRPGGPVTVEGVAGRRVIADGSGQVVELLALEGSMHADDMLVAYLPRVKAIVESDLLQPWINPIFGGGRDAPHPYLVHLYESLERLGVDYEQFVPIHRPPEPPTMPKSALVEAVRGKREDGRGRMQAEAAHGHCGMARAVRCARGARARGVPRRQHLRQRMRAVPRAGRSGR